MESIIEDRCECGAPDFGEHVEGCTLAVTAEELLEVHREMDRQGGLSRELKITRHLWIKQKSGAITLLNPLKPSQKKLANLVRWLRKRDIPVRVIVLKARKIGVSTWVEADMFFEILERQIDGLVIAHELDLAKYIASMTHMFYDRYDLDKPKEKHTNPKELTFVGHHGRLMVTTANNKMAGTGMTPQYVHATEVPKWETGSDTAVSLFQSVGNETGTTVILEGTANGYDGLFYPYWKEANDNCKVIFNRDCSIRSVEVTNSKDWNYFYPLFSSVFDDPDCRMEFATEQERIGLLQTMDQYETYLIESGIADAEYLKYRRFTLKNQCKNEIEVYHQEHPETAEQAFIASGRPRFSRSALTSMVGEDGRRGMLLEVQKGWEKKIEFVDDSEEFLTVFRTPVYGHRYVIGVDTSEGKIPEGCKKSDRSAACVIDKDQGCEQVAVIHGAISEENMCPYINLLGRWYNMAYLVIEINWGGQVIPSKLMGPEYKYPGERFFHIDDWKEGKSNRAPGFRTTVATRYNLIVEAAHVIQHKECMLHHKETIVEAMNFVWKDSNRVEAQKGFYDDLVFAFMLAVQGVKHYPIYSMSDPNIMAKMAQSRENRRKTVDSITGY